MLQRRRDFVIATSLVFAATISGSPLAVGQSRHKSLPDPPLPGDPQQRDKLAVPSDLKNSRQSVLHRREQEFRSGVEKLFQLSSELREDLKNMPSTDVLSVRMYKRVQEIEKLAKQLESEVKG
jgi:hypothetical protein